MTDWDLEERAQLHRDDRETHDEWLDFRDRFSTSERPAVPPLDSAGRSLVEHPTPKEEAA